jgi:hypothetical protein
MGHRLHFTTETRSALSVVIGWGVADALELDHPEAFATWTNYLALAFGRGEILAFSVDSVSAESDDPREEYFRLSVELRSTLPSVRRWPEGPKYPWRVAQKVAPVVGAKVAAATVLTSETLRGGCEVGVRLAMSNGCALDVLGEHAGPPLALGIELMPSSGGRHGV